MATRSKRVIHKIIIFSFQKLELVPVPRDSYGQFYNGDAYIVLSSTEYGQTGGTDTRVSKYRTLLLNRDGKK